MKTNQIEISPDDRKKFLELASRLSPENLSCDGEMSRTQIRSKEAILKLEWSRLEKKVGCKVSEDEVWGW